MLVLDELGRIGTRELLELLRHREQIGFKLVAVGDDKQCSAIEAGSVVDLLRQALGEERIPEILSTIRQQSEREREIAGLFRKGEVAQAVAAKREDGTAELVEGGYRQAVERVADLWAERRRATHNRPDYRITISAPTNADAREIGRAVRDRRRAMGEVTGPDHERRATDGRGDAYVLDLARGDDVRLFRRTRAVFTDGQGRGRSANIGDNGSVLRVEAVLPAEGLMLRAESGKVGFVSWRELEDRATGRTLLTWGSCLTIDAAQGLTSDEHINALPSGSKAATGQKAYVAASRHRVASFLVGSAGAELRQERERRPRGVPEPATVEGRQQAAWANLVRNLGKSGAKENATALLERSSETRRQTVGAFQAGLRTREAREAAGQKPVVLRENQERRALRAALPRIAEAIEHVAQEQAAVAGAAAAAVRAMSATALPRIAGSVEHVAQERAATVRPMAPPARRARISELEAQQQLYNAMRAHGLKPRGMPVMDGTLRYVPVEGNKGREKSGAYRAYYDDGWPSAALWNWKRGGDGGFVGTWTADAEAVPMSAAEQAALARQQAERAAARERERQAREDAGAAKAEALWEGARPADPHHPYLAAKGVPAYGLRMAAPGQSITVLAGDGSKREIGIAGHLLVPLRDADGRLRNLQTIAADGSKLYLPGAQKVGTFHLLGEPRPGASILIAEGYATAATAHRAAELPVAIALDTSNLKAVALALHERDPARPIYFAADNDHHLPLRPVPLPNAGREKAEAAAKEVGGEVLLPPASPRQVAKGKGTDWNDYEKEFGLTAVQDKLFEGMRLAEAQRGMVAAVHSGERQGSGMQA